MLHGDTADTLIVTARIAGGRATPEGIARLPGRCATAPACSAAATARVDGQRAAEVDFVAMPAPTAVLGKPEDGLPLVDQVVDETIAALAAEAVGAMQVAARR